jgi:hypothetical protein
MGKLHKHKTLKDAESAMRSILNWLCECGHRLKEHHSIAECNRCSCVQLRKVGLGPMKGIQPRRWVGNKYV